MMVVVAIIGVLLALLFPAIQMAREAGRETACRNNLRQIGIGLTQHSEKFGTYCSGAFDWLNDGAVTEVGWVADLMKIGIPAGKMLCPSNPAQIAATYNDLLTANVMAAGQCGINWQGSAPKTNPDGSLNLSSAPCYQIINGPLAPGSAARTQVVQTLIYDQFYNTNYTASWWLVRSGLVLDGTGNITSQMAGCAASEQARWSTLGPLTRALADGAGVPLSFLPLMACGGTAPPGATGLPGQSVPLTQVQWLPEVSPPPAPGSPTTQSFTNGPVSNPSMTAPNTTGCTQWTGPNGGWSVWNSTVLPILQDYRAFGPVHRGSCNLLMADGGVQSYYDANNDHLLNNGFTGGTTTSNGFSDSTIELPPQEVYSKYSLRP
jgi:prepilin-type processing-associated H-X9-DG protein